MNNAEARQLRLQAERATARRKLRLAGLRTARRIEDTQRKRDDARRQTALLAQSVRAPSIQRATELAAPDSNQPSTAVPKRMPLRRRPAIDRPPRKPVEKRATHPLPVRTATPPRIHAIKLQRKSAARMAPPRKPVLQRQRVALPLRKPSAPRAPIVARPAQRVPLTQKAVAIRVPRLEHSRSLRTPHPLSALTAPGKRQRLRPTRENKSKLVPHRPSANAEKPKRAIASIPKSSAHRALDRSKARVPATPRSPAAPPPRSAPAVKIAAKIAAKTLPRPTAPESLDSAHGISWLTTKGNRVLNEDGVPVLLRGINVAGVDEALANKTMTPADALGLTDSARDILAHTWRVNLVRLSLGAGTIHGDSAALAALDDLTATLNDADFYVVLALEASLSGDRAAAPDDTVYAVLGLLAAHYRDSPGVLFEPYASPRPRPEGWHEVAHRLIGAVRIEHPAALVLVSGESGGGDVTGLPIRFATGDPVHNVIYTARFEAGHSPAASDPRFHAFALAYPLMASTWSNGGYDWGRSAERAGQLFNRYGMSWVAAHWNAEPRLVKNAGNGDFTPTRFGLDALRALALPVRLALPYAAAAFGIASSM